MALFHAFESMITAAMIVIALALVLIYCFASQLLDALTGRGSSGDMAEGGSFSDDW